MDRETLKRLGKEFWAPALLAVIWTVYSLWSKGSGWTLTSVVNVFGPSFFLVSWATGQFFRVRKQTQVEKNLGGIEVRLESLVASLEKHTKDFIGYATGADSVAYFSPSHPISTRLICLDLHNESKYPVFDFHSELIDLDEPIEPEKGKFWTRHRISIPSLYPNKVIMQVYRFDMTVRDRYRLNVFIQTRTQGLIQQFRIVRVEDRFHIALKTTCGNDVLEKRIPDDFPGLDPANPEAIFQ